MIEPVACRGSGEMARSPRRRSSESGCIINGDSLSVIDDLNSTQERREEQRAKAHVEKGVVEAERGEQKQ